jgi:acyl carrier protein
LILGGETFPWSLADQLLEGDSECRLFNHYGPTETTVGSLMFEVERGQPRRQDSKSVPIGRPLANTEVYVLDESMNPVPVGVPGELFIGGAGVSAGYIGRADLTHERFALHAFSRGVRKRLYRTGDVVRYLTDGNIEFLGRRDHQVKLRGFRVELGEVEAALRAHPTIDDAVVVAHEGKADDIKLVAYVVAEGGLPIGVDEVRSFVRETLPEYMVPSDVVSLQFLPLTRNGKVDRSALPAPNQQRARAERSFVAPRTPLEEAVAELWAQVLKVERVGIEDDFFELGGHSLLVTQVISRIRNRLDVDLPLRTIFEHPTVAGLALAIAERQARVPTEHVLNPLLDELELMSNDEAARLLKSELPHHP